MSPEAQQAVAEDFLLLAALQHLAITVVAVLFWIRRRSMERTVAVYLALAFGTVAAALAVHLASPAAAALATRGTSLVAAALAAALSVLWILEAARPVNVLSFRRAPRIRLGSMTVAALFALVYPGYSGELPSFVFSPLGVTLPPTLLVALAVMNSAAPATNRLLHWALAVVGLYVGTTGLVEEGWIHAPLLAASAYSIPLLLGRASHREDPGETDATSVRAVHDRMHKRRVLLSKPRRPSVRKLDVRGRRK